MVALDGVHGGREVESFLGSRLVGTGGEGVEVGYDGGAADVIGAEP